MHVPARRRPLSHFLVPPLVIAFVMMLAACGGGGDDDEPTPNATTEPTRDATAGPTRPGLSITPSGDIRGIDLESVEDVEAALGERSAAIVQEAVIYADVTGDSIDDAVAPVATDGTLGNLGFFVLTPTGDDAAVLLEVFPDSLAGLQVDVRDGDVVMTQPVFGPDDPECCPSFLRVSTYEWVGTAMALMDVQTVDNPDALGDKLTPEAAAPPSGAPR